MYFGNLTYYDAKSFHPEIEYVIQFIQAFFKAAQ